MHNARTCTIVDTELATASMTTFRVEGDDGLILAVLLPLIPHRTRRFLHSTTEAGIVDAGGIERQNHRL